MKKLIPLLIVFLSYGCVAQYDPLEPILIDVPLRVKYINSDEMGLFSKELGRLFKVDPKEVELEKVYWFWLSLNPCNNCETRTGSVLDFSITPEQASRDIAKKRLK